MTSPKYSVVIPTRERADTLRHCLRTCHEVDYSDYEIIIADNYSSSETHTVVKEFSSPRVKYFRSDRPLSMSNNWERALDRVSGEWILFIGDDDALLPHTFSQLDRVIDRKLSRAIRWEAAYYVWPSPAHETNASNYLRIPVQRGVSLLQSHSVVEQVLKFQAPYSLLPSCYHGVFHRSLFDDMRMKSEKVFVGRYPDIYLSFAATWLEPSFVSLDFPLTLVGHSPRSNGGNSLVNLKVSIPEFHILCDRDQLPRHPWLGKVDVPCATFLFDSFLIVKDIFFPKRDDWKIDRSDVVKALVEFSSPQSEDEWKSFISELRDLLRDDPSCLSWFESYIPSVDKSKVKNLQCPDFPKGTGFNRGCLHLDAARFNVENVYDAARVCDRLLCLNRNDFRLDNEEVNPKAELGRLDRLGLPRPLVKVVRKILATMGKQY